MTRIFFAALLTSSFCLSGWRPATPVSNVLTPEIKKAASNEVAILFLFDVSGSMLDNNKMANAKKAAASTLTYIYSQARLNNLVPTISILAFSGDCTPNPTTIVQPFTSDTALIRRAIEKGLPAPKGNTPTPQAIENADRILRQQLKASGNCEGTLIILTDGQSSCGSLRPAGAYSEAKTNKVIIPCDISNGDYALRYQAIGFDIKPGSDAENDLKYVASTHNGKYFHAQNGNDGEELKKVFEKVGRIFVPIERPQSTTKLKPENVTEFSFGVKMIQTKNYDTAYAAFNSLLQKFPEDSAVIYNYGLMCEAGELYKGAIVNYEKYLKQNPTVPNKLSIEETIAKLRTYFPDQYRYQKQVVNADMNFIDSCMVTVKGGNSITVAGQFTGFVTEKTGFYETLPKTLNVDDSRVQSMSGDVVSALKSAQRQIKVSGATWDQTAAFPAVSLIWRRMKTLNELLNELQLK